MRKPPPNPTRLSRLPEAEDNLGLGRLLRNARELPDEEFPTLWWQLRTSQQLHAMRHRLFLRVSLVIGVVFFLGGVVGAAVRPFWARTGGGIVHSPAPAVAPTSRHGKPRTAAALPGPPAPSKLVSDVPAPADEEPRPVTDEPKLASVPAKHHRAAAHVAILNEPTPSPAPSSAPAMAPQPAAPSPIAVEQALLGRAIRMLRDGHDARASLALLAQHAERFPDGALLSEATMLRIEAQLTLGLRDEALSILDKVPLASLPNRDEQLVVRGELRAAKGRWREAKHDFDEALKVDDHSPPAAQAKPRNIQERALWGRASARSRLGDQSGARTDLNLYLRYFPDGRFADPAASLVKAVQ